MARKSKKAREKQRDEARAVPEWQIAENVVAARERLRPLLDSSDRAVVVHQNAIVPRRLTSRSGGRQIDVVVDRPSGGSITRRGIDVKAKGRPLTVEQMGSLLDKHRRVELDESCVVSTAGFAHESELDAREDGVELTRMVAFDRSAFFVAPSGQMMRSTGPVVLASTLAYDRTLLEASADLALALRAKKKDLTEAWLEGGAGAHELKAVIRHWVTEATKGDRRRDGEVFQVTIQVCQQDYHQLRVGRRRFPAPPLIVCQVEWRDRPLPDSRFRLEGTELVTTEVMMRSSLQQLTAVGIPDPSGGFRVALSVAPAKPPRIVLSRIHAKQGAGTQGDSTKPCGDRRI